MIEWDEWRNEQTSEEPTRMGILYNCVIFRGELPHALLVRGLSISTSRLVLYRWLCSSDRVSGPDIG